MKDFCEAMLTLKVNGDVADVYKRAIENENYPFGLRDHWNGVYASVDIIYGTIVYGDSEVIEEGNAQLSIQLLSHTPKSLKQVVDWYERMGCTVVRADYKDGKL